MVVALWPVWLTLLSLGSSGYFFVEATKAGMKRKNWALGGLVMGPMLVPLFTIHRFIHIQKASGRQAVYFNA